MPLPLKSADVYAAAPELRACAELDLQDASAAVRAAARKAFASRRLLQVRRRWARCLAVTSATGYILMLCPEQEAR